MLKKSVHVVALLLIATNLWAAPPTLPMDISATWHNMSTSSPFGEGKYKSGNEDEVCIFCHTPHGGTLDGPLWNRTLPQATGFTHYTSTTLSGYFTGLENRTVNPESMLCMSCHDGTTAMNSIINYSNRTDAQPDNVGNVINAWFQPGAAIGDAVDPATGFLRFVGNDLSDDHPISFSYYSAWNHADNNLKLNHADNDPAHDPRDKGIRFFGDPSAEQRVECSSCHDPHVNYTATGDAAYTPFLVMSNAGSALCLACHIK